MKILCDDHRGNDLGRSTVRGKIKQEKVKDWLFSCCVPQVEGGFSVL